MSIVYNKIDLDFYDGKINEILNDESLIKMGIRRDILGFTTYGYPIDLISVGYGDHDLFIVGGTHSCEIISVDYVLQLIKNISSFPEFDPNVFTIKVIPIQNPEGFDICTSSLFGISDIDFESKSKEYFLRYRTDSLIFKVTRDFNALFDYDSATSMLNGFKELIKSPNWKNLSDKRAMPNIVIFNGMIECFDNPRDFDELFTYLSKCCTSVISKLDDSLHDSFLKSFMEILNDSFISRMNVDLTKYQKLHQMMFDGVSVFDLKSSSLEDSVRRVYSNPINPRGSIVTHDSTGQFINLNANHTNNPGISVIKNNEVRYGFGPRSNVRNYFPGPLGIPCLDVNNFEFAPENRLLYDLLIDSYSNGRYFATLLYHGTGGMIYYKPYEDLMSKSDYSQYLSFNSDIANIYNEGISHVNASNTGYRKLEDSGYTGYGDLLRRTLPGVLLIELSRMGGNPISPYGDSSNIYNTFNENFEGFRYLLDYYTKKISSKKYIK